MPIHKNRPHLRALVGTAVGVGLVVGCGAIRRSPTPVPVPSSASATPFDKLEPTPVSAVPTRSVTSSPAGAATRIPAGTPTAMPHSGDGLDGLSDAQVASLGSLEKVDDYPLYVMRIIGSYDRHMSAPGEYDDGMIACGAARSLAWACSLFAALGDRDNMLYGRNFDWEYSPALLLFTDPPDGYASASMVDIAYLGFGDDVVRELTDLPLRERRALLNAPFLPFDGMNEKGLVIGMAAVPGSEMPHDAGKETLGSLGVIREMLDHAGNVEEAIAVLQRYNVDWGGGPPLHYLLADVSGSTTLVEFYRGEMVLVPTDGSSASHWHLATNFLRSSVGESAEGVCSRYDRISRRLLDRAGRLGHQDAVDLLNDVSQDNTQWSVVYRISSGDIDVAMGRRFDSMYTFSTGFPKR